MAMTEKPFFPNLLVINNLNIPDVSLATNFGCFTPLLPKQIYLCKTCSAGFCHEFSIATQTTRVFAHPKPWHDSEKRSGAVQIRMANSFNYPYSVGHKVKHEMLWILTICW